MEATRRPVGYLRMDTDLDGLWVSLVVDREVRGRGYGTEMLRLAQPAHQSLGIGGTYPVLFARLHYLNTPSLRAFQKAGFVKDRTDGAWLVYRKD